MDIVVPLEDTLGMIWRLTHQKEIPCGLYCDYNTTRRNPGDYLEILVAFEDTWR